LDDDISYCSGLFILHIKHFSLLLEEEIRNREQTRYTKKDGGERSIEKNEKAPPGES
jgi:hypothetical protein